MQQLASQSSQISFSSSVVNRLNLKSCIDSLTNFIQEFNLSEASLKSFKFLSQLKVELQNLNDISKAEPKLNDNQTTQAINKLLNEILLDIKQNALNNQHEKILDPSLRPIVNELLKLTSENQCPPLTNSNLDKLLTNSKSRLNSFYLARNKTYLPIHSQFRGFKTKRNIKSDELASSSSTFSSDFNLKNIFNPSPNLNNTSKIISKNKPLQNLGTLLDEAKDLNQKYGKSPLTSATANPEITSLVKNAFTEGVIFGSNRSEYKKLFFRLFLITLFVFFLLNTVVITTSTNANNKNGTGGGINLRALTGSVDYEVNAENVTVKFEDVKGLGDAKKELIDIVDFLKDPERYTQIGARLPKGILLVGPPGCGKTLLAKAVAGEASVPYFQANGSDFDEMFVGTGSKRVRSLFAAARAKAPCVIFIDEIDSVGSQRTNSSIHPHANQTINQLLAEMDGFKKNEGIIVLGATNRRDALDSALIRAGRFDMEVRIDRPDFNARCDILEYYLDKVARDEDVDVAFLSRKLAGFGGSAIENIVNQAALRAAVTRSNTVKQEHLEWSLDRTLMGYGKSRLQDEECNRTTAYHEAGHALVAYFTKDSHPLHKVTILPRAQSLGHTSFVPEKDGYSMNRSQLLAQLDVAMGGRVAEEIMLGTDKITTGAHGDFTTATNLATQMVKNYGMSEKIGPRTFDSDSSHMSTKMNEVIDEEIKKTLNESYERAKTILRTHSNELKQLAEALLIHETLDADQIKRIIEHHKL